MSVPQIWKQQCEAARGIREHFGSGAALDYILRQKFFDFLRLAQRDRDVAAAVPVFAAAIRGLFTASELRDYLDSLHRRRVAAALAHEGRSIADVVATVERMTDLLLHPDRSELGGGVPLEEPR